MVEPLRVRILDKIAEDLASIRAVNEYYFDLDTNSVKQGRAIFGDDDPLPMVSILEVPIPLDQVVPHPDSPYSNGTWELVLQGFVQDDETFPTRPAHRLMADVKKKLVLSKETGNRNYNIYGMGYAIVDLRVGAGVVRPPDEVSAKAYFWLNLSLDITESLTNPRETQK